MSERAIHLRRPCSTRACCGRRGGLVLRTVRTSRARICKVCLASARRYPAGYWHAWLLDESVLAPNVATTATHYLIVRP